MERKKKQYRSKNAVRERINQKQRVAPGSLWGVPRVFWRRRRKGYLAVKSPFGFPRGAEEEGVRLS